MASNIKESQRIQKWERLDAQTIREMIKHENDLINHRITWMVTLQGLLFAALGFAWKGGEELIYVLVFLGIASTISIHAAIKLAHKAIENLVDNWYEHKPDDYRGPDVIGYRCLTKKETVCLPWFLLPFLLISVWIVVFILNILSTR